MTLRDRPFNLLRPVHAVLFGIFIGAGSLLVYANYTTWSFQRTWSILGLTVTGLLSVQLVYKLYRSPPSLCSPRVLYSAAFAMYFTMGTLNLTKRGGHLDPSLFKYFGIGLLSFVLGTYLADLMVRVPPRGTELAQVPEFPSDSAAVLKILALTSQIMGIICLVLAWSLVGGIPLFNDRLRLSLNSYLTSISQASWAGILLYGFLLDRQDRLQVLLFSLFGSGTLVILAFGGYRAPIFLGMLTAIIAFGLTRKSLSIHATAATVMTLVLVSSCIPLVRSSFLYGYRSIKAQYVNQGIPESLVFLGPIHAVVREGPLVFSRLKDVLHGRTLNGRLIFSDWISMLPGKQDNSRLIISNLLLNPTETSKTPSVVGSLFVDFGTYGIAIGLFLIGFYLQILYRKWLQSGSLPLLFIYAFSLAYHMISIHTGGFIEPVYVLTCGMFAAMPLAARLISHTVSPQPSAG